MHHEADRNSVNSCQLIPTHYMTNIKLKRVDQMNGSMAHALWLMRQYVAKLGQDARVS